MSVLKQYVSDSAAQSQRALERRLGQLLWAQLARQGWLAGSTGMSALYLRWREACFALLGEQGIDVAQSAPDWDELWCEWRDYVRQAVRNETLRAQVVLVDAALQDLPAVLRGERSATGVLFPEGSFALVEGVYRDHPVADYFNAVLGDQLKRYVQARIGADARTRLRIAEIGAGTGGTSASLFALLAPYKNHIEEYCYTDLSAAFLLHAQKRFAETAPYLRTDRLDIEQNPVEQGFEVGGYDVVVAANVLHATQDIRRTLQHAKTLLKRNGLLLLNELSAASVFSHLTFGLLEGWWLAQDDTLRIPGTPALSPAGWRSVLTSEGFGVLDAPAAQAHALGQQIVVAVSDGIVRVTGETICAQPSTDELPPGAIGRDAAGELSESAVEQCLVRLLANSLRLPAERIDPKAPMEQYGIDSLMIVTLTQDLEGVFGPLSKTLFFEYTNIAALAKFLLREHRETFAVLIQKDHTVNSGERPSAATNGAQRRRNVGRSTPAQMPQRQPPQSPYPHTPRALDIAIVGISGRYPQSANLGEYWENLFNGTDCITAIPADRRGWNAHAVAAGKAAGKWGGFIDGVDAFDPLFFNISPREAQLMDPQERLFLECAFSAIEDAGYTRANLARRESADSGGPVGVFVGVMYEEYQLFGAQAQARGEDLALPGSPASIANRVSYFGNFRGPSLAVDTMCSSSLSAVHLACQSLRQGECDVAIAGGVNVTIHPNKYLTLAQGQFLSSKGRCESFGDGGDGFVPGEGVGAVILKPLHQAIADQDHIYGVVKGSAINHGGKTNGYTVPNPNAQARVIGQALENAGIHPRAISYVEAHGTGTSLGDPIEIAGLAKAFGAGTEDRQYCAIGSAKSNVGHCEGAAGMAGLTKVLLQMQHGKLVKNLHSDTLNSNIDFTRTPFAVQQTLATWQRPVLDLDGQRREYPRIAGISSFGAGGANAHLIVEEHVQPDSVRSADTSPVLVVLSARNKDRLAVRVAQLRAWLEVQAVDLADLAYTLQVGREAMTARLAFVVGSVKDLEKKLAACEQRGDAGVPEGVYAGEAMRGEQGVLGMVAAEGEMKAELERWIVDKRLEKLAELWVQGAEIKWDALHAEAKRRRVSLPTYPFARERYWAPRGAVSAEALADAAHRADVPTRVLHPLLHRNTSDLNELRYSTTLTGEEAFLLDHADQGTSTVPAMVQLEWARAAVSLALGQFQTVSLERVCWMGPLAVSGPLEVHIGLSLQADKRIAYEIFSGDGEHATVFSRGWAKTVATQESPTEDLESLRARCRHVVSGADRYAQLKSAGSTYGPSLHALTEVQVGDGVFVGSLDWPSDGPYDGYVLSPAALEGALRTYFGPTAAGEASLLPVSVESVEHWGAMTSPAFAVVRQTGDDSDRVRLEIEVVNEAGEVAVRLRGLRVRVATPTAAAQTLLLSPQWMTRQAVPADRRIDYAHHWVLLAGEHLPRDADADIAPARCVRLAARGSLSERYGAYAEQLLVLLQQIVSGPAKSDPVLLQFVVCDGGDDGVVLNGLRGLLASAQQEYPLVNVQLVLVDDCVGLAERLKAEAVCASSVVRYGATGREELEWTPAETPDATLPWRDGGVYWITGGLGGLGQVFAREIVDAVREPVVVLSGRSALKPDQQQILNAWRDRGARVEYHVAAVDDGSAMASLANDIVARHGRLNGVIHSAGVLRDSLLVNKTIVELHEVMAPKVAGLVALDEATRVLPLDWMVLFSSVASVWGNVGQADYAAANGFLDGYAQYRESLRAQGLRHGRTVSINWPLWADGQMQINARTQMHLGRLTGLQALPRAAGVDALRFALAHGSAHLMVLHGDRARLLERTRTGRVEPSATGAALRSAPTGRGYRAELKGLTLKQCVSWDLAEQTHLLLQIPRNELDANMGLAEYGFDSVSLTEFAQRLSIHYGIEVTPSLFFSFPSLGQLADYLTKTYEPLLEKFYQADGSRSAPPRTHVDDSAATSARRNLTGRAMQTSVREAANLDEPIAIIGFSGRFPRARSVDELWDILVSGAEVIQPMPADRMKDGPACDDASAPRLGTVPGVAEFDPLFFEIAPSDAELMDPRQRLLLQEAWRALEDAAYGQEQLEHSTIGMYVGVEQGDYQLLAGSDAVRTTNHDGILAARLSYFLNLQGPVMAINTACSSGLVALHQACLSLRSGECDTAIAAGVNLLLTPVIVAGMQQAGMLSPEGRCYAFDTRANGMVPGEAVVAVVLKRLSAAQADGDPIRAVIAGSGINYDGKTNGITAPSGAAQARLLESIYTKHQLDPGELDYIVTHGTGTPLGDPIEIDALTQAFKPHTQQSSFCALTSTKPNLGHTMAASGLVSLVSLVQAMQHETIPASLNCEQTSNYIDWAQCPFYINKAAKPWPARANGTRAGAVSAFGISGTNAHVVVKDYPTSDATSAPHASRILLAISAKSVEALHDRVLEMIAVLQSREWDENALVSMSHTLLSGRLHFRHRCAVVIQDRDDAVHVLQQLTNRDRHPNLFRNEVGREFVPQKALQRYADELLRRIADRRCKPEEELEAFAALADMYCLGYDLDSRVQYGTTPPRRISLPTYPFRRDTYWVESNVAPLTLPAKNAEPLPRPEPGAEPSHPQSGVRGLIRACITQALKLRDEQLRDDQPIISYGLDSINAARLIEQFNERMALKLPLSTLFECRTVDDLVARIDAQAPLPAQPKVDWQHIYSGLAEPRARAGSDHGGLQPASKGRPASRSLPVDAQLAEPIAVVGMSGRFPAAADIDEYWRNLVEGRDCITEIPPERWPLDDFYTKSREDAIQMGLSYNKWGGFLSSLDDAASSLIAEKAAEHNFALTEEQRLFLGTVYKLMESCGHVPGGSRQTDSARVGMFLGMVDGADQSPSTLASIASRIFQFSGPSLAIDTHSASSMTAIHMACSALALGDCDVAVAGGVAFLRPEIYITGCNLGMMSTDPTSRSFSAHRDGTILADGVGAVLLKPLSRAIEAGDQINAVIRSTVSSYVGDVGLSNIPAPDAIADSIRKNIARSNIDARTIRHFEAAAAGFKMADTLEMLATSKAFRDFTADREFCSLGSLKQNIGHATAASGVLQLIKVVLQMQNRKTTPFMNVDEIDPDLDLQNSPFFAHPEATSWNLSDGGAESPTHPYPWRALINSMGYGGFYAGAIVEEFRHDEWSK